MALARTACINRPDIRILFTARPEFAAQAEGLGAFLPLPAPVPDAVEAGNRLLATQDRPTI